jgi:hypothetical protein
MGWYRRVAIETYRNFGEPSSKRIRARPLPGQGYPPSMHVECSSKMRTGHPVGTVFVVQAQVIDRQGGTEFLYTSWQWGYEVIEREKAERLIASGSL